MNVSSRFALSASCANVGNDMSFNEWGIVVATLIVVLGVALEGAEHLHDIRTKGWRPLVPKVGFAVLVIGLALETMFEARSHKDDSQFRANATWRAAGLEKQIADANERAAAATRSAAQANARAADARVEEEKLRAENLKFERLFGGRNIVVDDAFNKLSHFKGLTLIVQVIKFPETFPPPPSLPPDRDHTEAARFADSFAQLKLVGWKIDPDKPYTTVGWAMEGVHVYSRRPEPGKPWGEYEMMDPYDLPIDTPQRKAWAAAEALTRYLSSDLGFKSATHFVADQMTGEITMPEPLKDFPLDAVVVVVGLNNPEENLMWYRLSQGLPSGAP
jgi:hypothetical protein